MKTLFCLLVIALLSACAPPLDTGPMRPTMALIQELSAPHGLQRNIQIAAVTVPKEFNTSDVGSIDSATLKSVIADTLYSAGYAVNERLGSDNQTPAKYALDATLKELTTPAFGFDLDGKCTISYKLTRISDGNPIFDEIVTQGYLATFGQAMIGAERARLARSHAVGENVTQLLRILNRLEIEEPKPVRNRRGRNS